MICLTKNWFEILKDEFDKSYFKDLQKFLAEEYKSRKVYPEEKNIFTALNLTKFSDVKAVIIGQDPYINEGQAHGLCFSVLNNVPPPSLVNIFKELNDDLKIEVSPRCGDLTSWAKQGVLLLNSVLTVRSGASFSHKGKGWETLTHKIIELLARREDPIVFIVWGGGAKSLLKDIDLSKHYILYAPHPSPLSAYSGFFGCKHFSKTNEILKKLGKTPIDWRI